ncbi:hypothetical protein FACS1894130_13240 [Spirochaetia bacterium]|nr:hypothetical protein FACS1894130_13240 [Spirochaetia bacterium]
MKRKDKPVIQASFGVRAAVGVGGGFGIGIVINPNNFWDSGVSLSIEGGVAFIMFPILAAFIFVGGFGLINNNSRR